MSTYAAATGRTARSLSAATSRSDDAASAAVWAAAIPTVPIGRSSAPVVRLTNGIPYGASSRQNSSSTWESPGTSSAIRAALDQSTPSAISRLLIPDHRPPLGGATRAWSRTERRKSGVVPNLKRGAPARRLERSVARGHWRDRVGSRPPPGEASRRTDAQTRRDACRHARSQSFGRISHVRRGPRQPVGRPDHERLRRCRRSMRSWEKAPAGSRSACRSTRSSTSS